MKIIFFGTTDFAVASLDRLVHSTHEVVAVVTVENKLGGRGRKEIIKSAVCVYAENHGLPLLQPKALKGPRFLEKIKHLNADLFVVVAFRMMPEILWSMPPLGTINLHGSLLPAYRGAAPINWAIINGENISGVSVFFLDQKIDTGKIIYRHEVKILPEETFGEYYEKLKQEGANSLEIAVNMITDNKFEPVPQNENFASHAPKLNKDNTRINFDQPAYSVVNLCRGLNPYPGAWCDFEGSQLKIFSCKMSEDVIATASWVSDYKTYLKIGCKVGSVDLIEIQPEGKKKMSIKEYLNGSGHKIKALKEGRDS